jgi:hypothetical protein
VPEANISGFSKFMSFFIVLGTKRTAHDNILISRPPLVFKNGASVFQFTATVHRGYLIQNILAGWAPLSLILADVPQLRQCGYYTDLFGRPYSQPLEPPCTVASQHSAGVIASGEGGSSVTLSYNESLGFDVL